MENSIAKIENTNKQLINTGTGLMVRNNESYLAESGFLYMSGARKFGDLSIKEDVARATAVSYLCGVRVFDKNGTLLIDKKMEKGCHYERERARQVVKEELLNILIESNKDNPDFDILKADKTIDIHLKSAYFSKSYKATNEWYANLLKLNL